MRLFQLAILVGLAVAGCHRPVEVDPVVAELAAEIDTRTLDSLTRKRAGTRYLRRAVGRLETARRAGRDMAALILEAQRLNNEDDLRRAAAVRARLLENHSILDGLGCFDGEGLGKLVGGKAPTITSGDHAGEIASADHIIPRSVAPELDNRLYNLRFMPEPLDGAKANTVKRWQVLLAQEWRREGLLSAAGLAAVEQAEVGREPS